MDNYCKRLIEVDLPIRRISDHARQEKNIRHGHISTLHIWWARRPLAACRAIVCATLWPDPVDELCPDHFRDVAREQVRMWSVDNLRLASAETLTRLVRIQKEPTRLDDREELRAALLDFVADFSDWNNSTVPEYLQTSRVLTEAAHEAFGGLPGSRPLAFDPFSGGGAIPLEALRVGANAFASDLNPVAVLLNKVVLEYIPKYGDRLASEVRRWGEWIKAEADKDLAAFYPHDSDGATPIGYLWARTILSEAPGAGDVPVEIPLMRSLWLAKTTRYRCAVRWVRDSAGRVETETVEATYANGTTRVVLRPLLEIFEPKSVSEVENGTVARGSATCPVTGYTTPVERVREQLASRQGGAADSRLYCVVTTSPGRKGRRYRLPSAEDLNAVRDAAIELERRKASHTGTLSLVPDEALPPVGTLGFRVQRYGIRDWGSLFTPRQALALSTLTRLVLEASQRSESRSTEFGTAVHVCLGLAFDRVADLSNSLCGWKLDVQCPTHLFTRQAIPMVWDFAESVCLSESSGSWHVMIERFADVLSAIGSDWREGEVQQANAAAHPLPSDLADVLITDPPYYDAVPYGDLSDFFVVWLRRMLSDNGADLFREALAPKEEECIVDPGKGKDVSFFEGCLTRALAEGRRILAPNGVGVVVFAHKSTRGWEAIIRAMVDAGWVITGSWPIDTEMGTRLRARNSAALASSVHLVCRPRENSDGSLRTEDVGDWRDVQAQLPGRIHDWMPRLADEGIVGADAIFACLGPALEIFSRYSSVEKASGEKVGLSEYLVEVWAAVSREALTMIFRDADASGFEEDARLTAMWLWTLHTSPNGDEPPDLPEESKSLRGYSLEYDAARKIAQGLGANLENLSHLVEVKGDTATLLSAGARTKYLFGKDGGEIPGGRRRKAQEQMTLDLDQELKELDEAGENWTEAISTRSGATVLDQLHQSMILFGASRAEALRRFLVDDGIGRNSHFWRLAQALSALYSPGTDEKRWVDGVLARKKSLGL